MSQSNPTEHPLGSTHTQDRQSRSLHEPRPTYHMQSRPSLSRLTDGIEKEVADAAASQRGSPLADGPSGRDMKGKGRGVEMVEVIVHQVKVTDSIMAVALKYGVGVATILKANKLWASDSIHLRTEIFIPLDACLKGNVLLGPEEGEATIVPRGHYRPKEAPRVPPLIRLDSDPAPAWPTGEIVPVRRMLSTSLSIKQAIPRTSTDSVLPSLRRSDSVNRLNATAMTEPRASTSSSRASLDLAWDPRPTSRTSVDAESEASIELRPRNLNLSQQVRQRPPRNLWFSVADDGIDPGQGMYYRV